MKFLRLFCLSLLLVNFQVQGQEFTEPGWFQSDQTLNEVPPEIAQDGQIGENQGAVGTGGLYRLLSVPEIAEAITPEIDALARGLENNATNIFNYVHDNIRYVHYFGSKKGAQLTLLERSGNDFDQCALLVALLRSAGHTSVKYRFGTVYMPYEDTTTHLDFKHWLGLTKPNTNWNDTKLFVLNLNYSHGFPYFGSFLGDTTYFIFHRVWVRLTIGGATYSLDPAFKVNEPIAGIDMATAMQLSTNTLMTTAAGTNTADYVQGLDESALRNKLRDYTTNFISYLQTNAPNASVNQIIGGQQIVSSVGKSFLQLTNEWPIEPYAVTNTAPAVDWNYIPTNFISTLNVQVDGTNQFLFMPELQGERLSLTCSTGGLAQLWLEDNLLLQKQTGGGSTIDVVTSVDHPHGSWSPTNNIYINASRNDHTATNTYQRTNASYALSYAFEADPRWLRKRQERLDAYRRSGLSDASREVVTETLNIIGLNWMVQTEWMSRLLAPEQQILLQNHHRIGRLAQENGKGYYIDIYQQLDGGYPASGVGTNDFQRSVRLSEWNSYISSAVEHGVIEQLQASNLVAASTVKMLQKANSNGQKIFLATSNNWTAGVNVRGQLINYSNATLNSFGAQITGTNNYKVLLPQNGSNTVAGAGTWAGYGAVLKGPVMQMLIDGKYNGGYSSSLTATVSPTYVAQTSISQPTYFNEAPLYVPLAYGADPVSMADGSFHLSTTDLSLGGAEPRGLSFSRHYSSSRRYHNLAGMAHGWVHNYQCTVADVSAPMAGLGNTTPAQAAAIIVAAKASLETYLTAGTPKSWAVTALIAKWGVDQIITNGVSISLGKDTLQFIKQPDGTFTPPAGCSMTLTKSGSSYNLAERHGNTFKFSATGLLTNIVDQYGKGMVLAYNSSNWVSTVTDWKSRQFTFSYTGTPSRLDSISDGSRTISFGYTTTGGQLDMTSFIDSETKTSTYQYDTNHQIIGTKDALNRVVVTNIYDNFGRVIEQRSQGDTNQAWHLYWGESVNTEEDPTGARKRYTYDYKQRAVAVEDALGHTSYTYYDGQDHVVKTITPLLATNNYSYDGRHNLTLIRDPLNQTKDLYYDAQDNLWRVWDERGYNSYFGYNSKFQLTGSTNGASEWVTYTYDTGDGALLTKVDPGGTTTYDYDSTYRQLNLITYPGSLGSESFVKNSLGDVTSHTNARLFATTFQYNARRQLTNTVAPTNLIVSASFDAAGNLASTTDARAFTTANTWSATRKLMLTTLPATPQGTPSVTNVYDRRDWLTQTKNPLQQAILYTNDAAGRLINVIDPLLRVTQFGYDNDNRKTSITNGAIEVTQQVWNKRNELIWVADPANRIVQRFYDAIGNQTILTNRNSKKWLFQFDGANRLTNTITPLSRTIGQTYNNRGLLSTIKEPSTDTTTLLYDAKGRLTNRTDSIGAITYRYDANNNLTFVIEGTKTNSWTYDAYNRVSGFTNAESNVIQYRYDANGNLTSLIYPGGKSVTYAYDSLNRMTNITDWVPRVTSIEYDLANQVKKITRPNGTVREMNYDAAGQRADIMERMGIGVPIAYFKFNWNNAARMQWEFTAPTNHSYTPPTRTMTYDDDNRLLTFNGATIIHDSDGNMTTGPLTNNTLVTYGYDARNRLLNAGGLIYGYDAMNNRTSITNGTNVTRFVVNPNTPLSQVLIRTKPDGSKTFYVYGAGLMYEANETAGGVETSTRTYHSDFRGSTVAITDASGLVTDRIEYSAYGTTTYRSGTNDSPFLFNGCYGVQTDSTGLISMRARYYNPYIGRFVNADPSGFAGGLNWYAYADGNPISYLDPLGLVRWGDAAVAGLGVLGNTVGMAFGGALTLAPEPTMLSKVAGVAVFGKSAYGFGANIGNLGAAIMDDQPYSKGSLVNDLANVGFPGNSQAQTVATVLDIGTDITAGGIGLGHSLSLLPSGERSLRNLAFYEIGQKTFTGAAVPAAYAKYANAIDRGAAIVAQEGWIKAATPSLSGFALGLGKTFGTGPTPLGLAGASIANSAGSLLNGWARESSQEFLKLPPGNK